MHKLVCAACGIGHFRARADQGFHCDHCESLVYPRCLSLDGSEAWAVDSAGTLGKVTDPAASLEDIEAALDDFLSEEPGTYGARAALRSLRDAASQLRDALDAGLPLPPA
jgi:hypothetical protein